MIVIEGITSRRQRAIVGRRNLSLDDHDGQQGECVLSRLWKGNL
jgi:hypothetical protein